MRKKNVLYSLNSSLIGGANRAVLGLLGKLNKTEFNPRCLIPQPGPMESELKALGIPYSIIDVSVTSNRFARFFKLLQLFFLWIRIRPNILHAMSPMSYRLPSLICSFFKGTPILHIEYPPTDIETEIYWAMKKRPKFLIACSKSIGAAYRKNFERHSLDIPVTIIENFADTDKFTPEFAPSDSSNSTNLTDTKPTVTIIGQLCERKGQADFIRMAAKLGDKAANYLVVGSDILTDGSYENSLRKLATDLHIANEINFLGFQNDIPRILRRSDIVVLASSSEGTPLSIIEAGACAKPVVAYNIPGVDELIENKKNGLLIPYGDVESLAAAVKELLDNKNLRDELGRVARQIVISKYSAEIFCSRVENLYQSV